MSVDGKTILYFTWALTIASLFVLIPKAKVRLALVAFFFKQVITWPLGLYVVHMGWIQYPIHFFENSNQTSFTFEYFFFPVMCAYFTIYYPDKKSLSTQAAYYVSFCSVITLAELYLLHNTNLIRYIHWNAYVTWISLFVTFYITRKFCLWFFQSTGEASK